MSNANKKSKQNREGRGRNLPKNSWLYCILAILLIYFLVFIGQPLSEGDWCLLNDFMGYFSAGQIMNAENLSAAFDFDLLREYQADIYRSCGSYKIGLEVISMVYLPIFLVPFQLLALLDYSISAFIWLILNFTLLILYLIFFSKKVFGKPLPFEVLLLILVSTPVFRNFFHGQVNLLVLICMGEFIRAIISDKPYRAGLWLGLVLIKPQMLVLLLPFLFIQKRYKVILGFFISSILIVGASFLFGGVEGMISFKEIIFESARGGATSNFNLMMNWRAVSYYITQFAGATAGTSVLIGGSVLTAVIPLVAFRKKIAVDSPMFMIALLGVTAATSVATYHAHTHSAMILIPLLLYLYMNDTLNDKLFNLWILTPSVFNFLQFLVGALVVLSLLPFGFAYFVNFSNGLVLFVLSLVLLGWAIIQVQTKEEASHTLSV